MKEVSIINYPYGNVLSLIRAFEYLKIKVNLIDNPRDVKKSNRLVFPGVGTFKNAIDFLKNNNFYEEIENFFYLNKPFLGICLGMQVLLDDSEELEKTNGFGIIRGKVVKLPNKNTANKIIKTPHMNWNLILYNKNTNPIFNLGGRYMYFLHSYHAIPIEKNELLAYSIYEDIKICAIIKKRNVVGCQFHPEKSGKDGIKFLESFMTL